MLYRIEEHNLYETSLIGTCCQNAVNDINHLVDIIFENDALDKKVNYDFFDIKGTVLLHGIAGVGKTTIARNCMSYALDRYGVESYSLDVSEIIVSGLGESVKNLHDMLQEFDTLSEGILFVDEIDKLFINRETSGELSELKRLLIEFMGYIDELSIGKKKLLIGCTNVYGQMDDALKRRFSINDEIYCPSNNEKNKFFSLCVSEAGVNLPKISLSEDYLDKFETMDSIKAYFRKFILDKSLSVLNEELQRHVCNN